MTPAKQPRFRDAHTHLAAGASDLSDLDLRGAAETDVVARIAAAALARARGSWIRGWGASLPDAWDAAELDRAAPGHPVFAARVDGHAAWVNGAAVAALGLRGTARRVDEAACDAARLALPAPSTPGRAAALRRWAGELAASGIVAVDDFVESWAPEVYAWLADRGELPLEVGLWLPDTMPASDAGALRRAFPPEASPIAVRGVKIFLDGTLGARTAALSFDYADAPGTRGVLRASEADLAARVAFWASRGYAVALHAIGDRAVTLALDALEAAPRAASGSHRIEHAQLVRHADLPRFERAGVVASLQPGHWRDDRAWIASRVGTPRDVAVYPIASFARARATIVFGSDWPVSAFDPRAIVDAACDPLRGREAWSRTPAETAARA